MSSPRLQSKPRNVVIVGGGIAAIEGVLALKDLGNELVRLTVVAPKQQVVLNPLVGATSYGSVVMSLAELLSDDDDALVCDKVVNVDADAKLVRCANTPAFAYDDLLLAFGAPKQRSGSGVGTCVTDAAAVAGLMADVELGYCRSIAFVVPSEARWPLAIYELALRVAHRAWDMCMDDVDLTLISHEACPLALFGQEASQAIAEHLSASGIRFVGGVDPQITSPGRIRIGPGLELAAQHVVTLPVRERLSVSGLPSNAEGRLPVDDFARVTGADNVYAAGAASDQHFMHAALACQMADVAAAGIAAAAGAAIAVEPLSVIIQGRVSIGTRSCPSVVPLWRPNAVPAGRYLTTRLASADSLLVKSDSCIDVQLAPPMRSALEPLSTEDDRPTPVPPESDLATPLPSTKAQVAT